MPSPTKLCPVCGRSVNPDAAVCPSCGHGFHAPADAPAPSHGYLPSPPPRSSFSIPANGPAGPAVAPVCLYCRREISTDSPICGHCGADQRAGMYQTPAPPSYPQTLAPPPGYAPPHYPPQAYPPQTYPTHYPPPTNYPTAYPPPVAYVPVYAALRPPDDFEMFDLERQYRDAKTRFTWMLILGLLVFMPLLIVACIDYNKMKEIKKRVALRGIHPEYWAGRL